ncbi:MAG: hypothetical protein WBP88_13265 [Nitrososphaeraceae archaeon]
MIYIFYQTRLYLDKNLISYKVKSLIVAVIIDISRTPKFLKSIIYKEIARFHVTDMNDSYLKMDQESNRQHVKSFLEEVFCAHSLGDYVIAENSRDDNELVILKKGDIEQIGLFICMHCSMIFGSAEERSEHLRAHYFV